MCVCVCAQPSYPFQEWRSNVAPVTQPNLDFMAPEYVLTMTCGTASDMFSLGLLIYAVFAKGKPLFECHGELSAFKSNAEEVRVICCHQNYTEVHASFSECGCDVLSLLKKVEYI